MNERIERALSDLRSGKFVLIFDAEGREEETDLVIASEFVTSKTIKTMRTSAGGLICTTVSHEIAEKLGLPFLTDIYSGGAQHFPVLLELIPNDIPYDAKSAFSLTINHRKTFTGITDADRALTVSEFAGLCKTASNGVSPIEAQRIFGKSFRCPGHIHLLRTSEKILQKRFGHTELSTAMVIMAGLVPSATICEMMNGPKGKCMPKEKAKKYAEKHGLAFLEGREIIEAWNEYTNSKIARKCVKI
ncbi:MAG: 3,4-dihydroxy-2-butanone-4-phosphate synthase [Candidatus Thermoplasmatota archaeon]|nr:3,4-dihydroxy-2-butanone-4-phosphate synthase [Candidatus Thermoplasmatota archaeon]